MPKDSRMIGESSTSLPFSELLSHSNDAVVLARPTDGRVLYINETAIRFIGRSRRELEGMSMFELRELFTGSPQLEPLLEKLENEGTLTEEAILPSDDPAGRFVEVHVRLIDLEKERYLLAIGRDITNWKRTQEELEASEQRYRNMFEAAGDGLVTARLSDGEFIVEDANRQMHEMLGYEDEELVGTSVETWSPKRQPDGQLSREAGQAHVEAAMKGETRSYIWSHQHKDGSLVDCEVTLSRFDLAGELKILASCRDLTERRAAEARDALHLTELTFLAETAMKFVEFPVDVDLHEFIAEQLKRLLGGGYGVAVTEYDETTQRFSIRALRGLGRVLKTAAKVLGRSPMATLFSTDAATLETVQTGRLTELTTGLSQVSGGTVPPAVEKILYGILRFQGLYAMGLLRKGRIYGTVALIRRVGDAEPNSHLIEAFVGQAAVALERRHVELERAQLEEQLLQAQKMEAIGTLAGGIAHDFNNLLMGILGSADSILLETEPGDEIHESAEVIEKAAERAAELTKQLLGFARKGKLRSAPVDVHRVLTDTIALLDRTLVKGVELTARFEAERCFVTGDRSQLQQVFMNVVVNARDAMTDGGEVVVTTSNVVGEKGQGDQALLVMVSDPGQGMDEATRKRIFEPFFTTKKMSGGTGMGLAMVYGIVRNHGGSIEVESAPGRGTKFRLHFPLSSPQELESSPASSSQPIHGVGSVLVVDDEETVRRALTRMLQGLGYEVTSVASGAQAIELFRQKRTEIDLIILDMAMPSMDGRECFTALKEIDPKVKAILATGHSLDGSAQELLDRGVLSYLQKPFRTTQLAAVLSKVLERG